MSNEFEADKSLNDGGSEKSIADFLARAQAAADSGDALLSMYMYLAAFEESSKENNTPSEATILGLKSAWALAGEAKERQLAEYIFDLLEPYLSSSEIEVCAEALHDMTMDKLEEFGLSREDLSEAIAQAQAQFSEGFSKIASGLIKPSTSVSAVRIEDAAQGASATANAKSLAPAGAGAIAQNAQSAPSAQSSQAAQTPQAAQAPQNFMKQDEDSLDYAHLVGFDRAKAQMNELGIGMNSNENYKDLLSMLNRMHGLDTSPSLDPIIFQATAREDANQFVKATLGEMNLPTLQMHMEEGFGGMPLLCVAAHGIDLGRAPTPRDIFKGGGVLVMEDLDLWYAPELDFSDETGFFLMQLTRGAREAVDLIQAATENPDVYVFATVSDESNIEPFFMDLLEPITVVDIDLPTPEERAEIWLALANDHPSIRDVNRVDLVRLSANMPRFDIYMAATEAIEDAYKLGLKEHKYVPVTREVIFDKLAAYQPLESDEYNELQDAVLSEFSRELSQIDSILDDN